jgi:Mg2+ and Co2+ transporter CorA
VLRRIAIPLKRTVNEITAKDIGRFSEEDLTLYFDDVNDHIDKVIDTIEESKETIEIYKDTDYLHGTDRSNKILAILTIVFTLSMPVTIMSSLYGMNVDTSNRRGVFAIPRKIYNFCCNSDRFICWSSGYGTVFSQDQVDLANARTYFS